MKTINSMGLLLCRLLAFGGAIIGSVSKPTRTQAVFSLLDKAHGLEQNPNFGVGFDLTASYGHEIPSQLLVEELQS